MNRGFVQFTKTSEHYLLASSSPSSFAITGEGKSIRLERMREQNTGCYGRRRSRGAACPKQVDFVQACDSDTTSISLR